jgi:signal-transduction protein with cAMP-binding, CBS, and nucleotidyltransferase domain
MDDAYLSSPVEKIMDKNVIILDESACINEAARVMEANGVTSVLVRNSKTGAITGIVTERDILYRAVAKSLGTFKVNIGNIMSTPLVTVEKGTRCIEAIRIMREKDLRRLPVIIDGKIAGMATLVSLVGNVTERNIDLIELELPHISESTKITCPYCGSKFTDKVELSRHIDRLHLGSGLLEGDTRKWE